MVSETRSHTTHTRAVSQLYVTIINQCLSTRNEETSWVHARELSSGGAHDGGVLSSIGIPYLTGRGV